MMWLRGAARSGALAVRLPLSAATRVTNTLEGRTASPLLRRFNQSDASANSAGSGATPSTSGATPTVSSPTPKEQLVTNARTTRGDITTAAAERAAQAATGQAPATSADAVARAAATSGSGRQRLVILGTGWGGYSLLRHIDKSKYDVVVVSPRNHFLFTPLLASTTVGTLEFRSIQEPIRRANAFRDEKHFHLAFARSLDFENKVVKCESSIDPGHWHEVPYDRLVIAVGAVPNTFNVPGVMEHAFFLKELSDARAIRSRLLGNMEIAVQPGYSKEEVARRLSVVVVGGGPTGVEFAAELHDFVMQDVRRLLPGVQHGINVTLVEAQQILPSFDENLRKFAEQKMATREGMRLLRGQVVRVTDKDVQLNDGTSLPAGLVVWSTGVGPREFTQQLSVPKSRARRILTDEYLRVKGVASGDVYAIGDCAEIEGNPLPATAQAAEREGRYLASALSSSKPEPFVYKPLGMLAYIGDYRALAEVGSHRLGGVVSWLIWRSAYTTRLGSWRLRMQVPFDWMKTFFFGRDISRF
eukprot:Opistho-1_new@48317